MNIQWQLSINFYMTSFQDVVRVLLKKFRVADSPHKYALYERNMDDTRRDR